MQSVRVIELDFPMPKRLRKVIDEIDNIYLKGESADIEWALKQEEVEIEAKCLCNAGKITDHEMDLIYRKYGNLR